VAGSNSWHLSTPAQQLLTLCKGRLTRSVKSYRSPMDQARISFVRHEPIVYTTEVYHSALTYQSRASSTALPLPFQLATFQIASPLQQIAMSMAKLASSSRPWGSLLVVALPLLLLAFAAPLSRAAVPATPTANAAAGTSFKGHKLVMRPSE
jgi:hypothetical protein